MKAFEAEWHDWALQCMQPGTSAANREALRIAFYSGAATYARLVARVTIGGKNREDALVLLGELHDEMREYAEDLLEQFGRPAVDNGRAREH